MPIQFRFGPSEIGPRLLQKLSHLVHRFLSWPAIVPASDGVPSRRRAINNTKCYSLAMRPARYVPPRLNYGKKCLGKMCAIKQFYGCVRTVSDIGIGGVDDPEPVDLGNLD